MTNEEIIQQLHYLIGSRYVSTVKAYIGELTARERVVSSKDFVTREFDIDRITVDIDGAGRIAAFSFG
ncbi:I78 family peptidase inhibitor [Pseudomonas syringae]|uniref:Peptidase inhibitor I78 family protein n=1 Tax=Pseudomonas syringae TaxID=317 RepID=A0A085VIN4_PSESX|nr:I78 family peptidase inhibitor [Pseudomonas syringae]KFE55297.1 hypothetical protein IV01_11750 [Pseudomonas syringae]